MGARIVKQPDGRLARFSEVVDNFTHLNMSVEEAVRACMNEGMGIDQARDKVKRGIDDINPYNRKTVGDGLNRWNDAIAIIKSIHGQEAVDELMSEIKGKG